MEGAQNIEDAIADGILDPVKEQEEGEELDPTKQADNINRLKSKLNRKQDEADKKISDLERNLGLRL